MRLIVLFFFSFGFCFTQSDKKTYFTKKIEDNLSPVIDGEISDEAWNQVEWSSGFIQFQPEENTQPSNQTKYKLLYDNYAVYIFVKSINLFASFHKNSLLLIDAPDESIPHNFTPLIMKGITVVFIFIPPAFPQDATIPFGFV